MDVILKLGDIIQVHIWIISSILLGDIIELCKKLLNLLDISILGDIIQVHTWMFWKNLLHLDNISKLSSFTFHLLLQTQVERSAEDESNPWKC